MSERILGIDYGSRRIGIAISDPLNIIATGLFSIENNSKTLEKIKEFIGQYSVKKVVIGMPLNLKGQKGMKAKEVDEFVTTLRRSFDIEIITLDERFSTKQAHITIREMNIKKSVRQKRERVDAMAAAFILQNYLDRAKRKTV